MKTFDKLKNNATVQEFASVKMNEPDLYRYISKHKPFVKRIIDMSDVIANAPNTKNN